MSQGEPMPRARALAVAMTLVNTLAPACDRVAIAGSLRREKPEVRDIEIVATARWENRPTGDIWSTEERIDVLEETIARFLADGTLVARDVVNHRADGSIDIGHKLGPAFKALVVDGIPLDLFIVRPPASWGVIFGQAWIEPRERDVSRVRIRREIVGAVAS